MATAYPPYDFNPTFMFAGGPSSTSTAGFSPSSFPPPSPARLASSSFLYNPSLAPTWDFASPSPAASSSQSPFAFNAGAAGASWPSTVFTPTIASADVEPAQDRASPFSDGASSASDADGHSDHEDEHNTPQPRAVTNGGGGGKQDQNGKKKRRKVSGGTDSEDEEERDKRDRRMSTGSVGSGDGEGKGTTLEEVLAEQGLDKTAYDQLPSARKRQLRNKVSARAFRARRKDYIETLEGQLAEKDAKVEDMRATINKLKEQNQALRGRLRHNADF